MNPGRELDALIAAKVMGWVRLTRDQLYAGTNFPKGKELTPYWYDGTTREEMACIEEWEICPDCGQEEDRFSPSTRIADAWKVVEHMQSRDWAFVLDNFKGHLGNWDAHFEKGRNLAVEVEACTAPHAICLAALACCNMEGA